MCEITFRKASPDDAEIIMEIIDYARRKMLDEGKKQWDENYPTRVHIDADIAGGLGHVICIDGRPEAYGAICLNEEPAYNNITGGKWLSDLPYVVVHRLAVSEQKRRIGLGMLFMQHVETIMRQRGIESFKVDTNYDNRAMIGLLDKMHFIYCGEIKYDRGKRMAYEKLLRQHH